jgi:hypothetical protein
MRRGAYRRKSHNACQEQSHCVTAGTRDQRQFALNSEAYQEIIWISDFDKVVTWMLLIGDAVKLRDELVTLSDQKG